MQRTRLHLDSMVQVVLSCLFLALSDGFAQGTAAVPNAHGTLIVDGKKTPLDYAYAVPQKDDRVMVILSDKPLGDKDLTTFFDRVHKAAAGEIHLVEITLNASKKPIFVSIRHKALPNTPNDASAEDVYEARTGSTTTVEGRFYRKSPGTSDGVKFSYDATVKATLWKEPTPSLAGTTAANSPQGKIALAFLKAAHAGDVPAMKRLATQGMISTLEGEMGQTFIDLWKKETDPQTAVISKVEIKGSNAVVTAEWVTEHSRESSEVVLELEKGEWKVASK